MNNAALAAQSKVLESAPVDNSLDDIPFVTGCKGLGREEEKKLFLKPVFDEDVFPENILVCPVDAR